MCLKGQAAVTAEIPGVGATLPAAMTATTATTEDGATETLPEAAAEATSPAPKDDAPRLPPSATHFGICLVSLGILIGTLLWLRTRNYSIPDCVLILCGAIAVPVVVLDVFVLRVHRRLSTGLDWDKPFAPDIGRVVTKILGFAFTIGLIALAYWAFPEYQGSFYNPFYGLLQRFWVALLVAIPSYIWIVDGHMREPEDAYWQLGRVVLGRPSDARREDMAKHFRGWLVKAFFFPLMFVWLNGNVRDMVATDLHSAGWANLRLYGYLNTFIYGVDLLFCTVGYAMSFRLIDTHLRSAEPTVYGWAVALFCYPPFYNGLMERQYVHYGSGYDYDAWLSAWPTLRTCWAGAILTLISIYTLASVAFGLRFSNLTHRGILTNGPYRYTKHPAYVTKNISWWLVSVPFIPHESWALALRHSLLLGCVNMIYFLRARTEEAHLSQDPTYVQYALWMNENGTLSFLGRWFPLLKYKAPANVKPAEIGVPVPAE